MQIDRSWTPVYASNTTPQPQQPSQYYARGNYESVALDDGSGRAAHGGMQDDRQTRDAHLGVWSHGNKRVRPNGYGTQDQGMESPSQQVYAPQTDTHIEASYADSTGGQNAYSSAPIYRGYDYTHAGGMAQGQGMEHHGAPLNVYGRTDAPSMHGSERLTSGAANHVSSPVPQQYTGQYGGHYGRHESLPEEVAPQHQYGSQQTQYYQSDMVYANPAVSQHGGVLSQYMTQTDWPDHPYSSAASWAQPVAPFDPTGFYGKDASLHLKLQSLSILDNLASQIILSLAKPSVSEIERLTSEDNEEGQAYVTRKNLFDQTRKVYCRDNPFIDAVAIQLFTPTHQETIRKANRATFISSIVQSHDVSFWDLNEFFLEIFVPVGQRLLKWQGGIFLELKTQCYISALLNSDGTVSPMLDELFPADLDERITSRHPDAPNLAPSEQDFLERARARKQYLEAEPPDTALHTLPGKYQWQDFMKELLTCISKNVDSLLNPANRSQSNSGLPQAHLESNAGRRSTVAGVSRTGTERGRGSGFGLGIEAGPSDTSQTFSTLSTMAIDTSGTSATRSSPAAPGEATSPSSSRAPKTPAAATPRQPWRQEEEEALMAGLAAVNGPHWSQILSLYGRGGSVSEVLKDRNQIQLKDKARNLKLWHLKMGHEVPACLQGVTGELRKRGGARVRAALGLDSPEPPDGKKDKEREKYKKGGGKKGTGEREQIDPALAG